MDNFEAGIVAWRLELDIRVGVFLCSPRYSEILAKKLEAMGGVRYMFLTHKYVILMEIISFSV